jgi:hypothetical protein
MTGAHRATTYDKQAYVTNARVTPRKGVTHSDPRGYRVSMATPRRPRVRLGTFCINVSQQQCRFSATSAKRENGANGASTLVDMLYLNYFKIYAYAYHHRFRIVHHFSYFDMCGAGARDRRINQPRSTLDPFSARAHAAQDPSI